MMKWIRSGILLVMGLLVTFSNSALAQNWPQWRGPDAAGVSSEADLPVKWSLNENIVWKVPLAGRGMSTPIVWQDHVCVTSQVGNGNVAARSARYEGPVPPDDSPVTFFVQCFGHKDGQLLWDYRVAAEGPFPSVHAFSNLAAPSPVTDGKRLYVWFGTGQILALTMEGRLLWQRSPGREISPFNVQWGHGSSPVLYNNSLILQCDHEPAAYLLALDRYTGKTLWKTERGKGLQHASSCGGWGSSRVDCQLQHANRCL
jgi:outer membrane protein assembly factor BamB